MSRFRKGLRSLSMRHTQECSMDSRGFAVEGGKEWVRAMKTYFSGESMPNYTLLPPSNLIIRAGSKTVDTPTRLSELLVPNMGTCHWAACSVVR
ncbi:putative adhesin [Polymorphospora sp. NPDC051019]|uniref:putative adhesin n=1 Tax=Polymorphospora sp. NPDC051019 TaxID=3155725 RepID=UPI00342BECB9